ncbi:MAG: sensor histidine kinase [Bacteroidales bacterium]|nr:MAG: sensor histidine kinase [Bacteroidales bacterium]
MKTATPRQMAIFIAFFSSLIAGIVMLITFSIENFNYLLTIILSLLIIFVVIYIFVFYILSAFILNKINPIYKTIYDINIPEDELKSELDETDIVTSAQKDVITWSKRKTREIAQFKQLEKYRQEFLGNMYHELKTPIFNIQGYISTLLEGGLKDQSINKQYLENTDKNINRLISIVNDLESISELESGIQKLNLKKLNIKKLFEESFEMNGILAKKSGIKLKFAKKQDKPVNVMADRKRILQVINNLVINSIKYGKKNGSTTIDFIDMGKNILVEVSDNGIGIPKRDIPRIYERFYRVDKSHSSKLGGTGLGLSIVKHIIEAHNQKITVRSKVDEGSSFTFTLKKA